MSVGRHRSNTDRNRQSDQDQQRHCETHWHTAVMLTLQTSKQQGAVHTTAHTLFTLHISGDAHTDTQTHEHLVFNLHFKLASQQNEIALCCTETSHNSMNMLGRNYLNIFVHHSSSTCNTICNQSTTSLLGCVLWVAYLLYLHLVTLILLHSSQDKSVYPTLDLLKLWGCALALPQIYALTLTHKHKTHSKEKVT